MIQSTLHFGEVECAESDVIHVAGGITPFREARRWVLLADDEETPFSWLQSLDDPALAFVLAPLEWLSPQSVAQVMAGFTGDAGTAGVFGIVVLSGDPSLTTVNLLAPLLLDFGTMAGRQVIVDGPPENARVALMDAVSGRDGGIPQEPAATRADAVRMSALCAA
jgi:flagellar assembly factor FliW